MDSDDLFIDAFLERDQASRNIVKVISKTSTSASQEGGNYLSVVRRVAVTVLRQSGKKERVSLIVKMKPAGEGRDAFLQESGAFKKEIMVYLHVLNAMESEMKENDDYEGILWCHMIGYNPYDCIVFEDLSVQGFRLTDSRLVFLDLDHSLIVMQSLGRFHGLSKVLMKKGLLQRNDFTPHFLIANLQTTERVMGHCLKLSGKHIKTWGNEWVGVGETLMKYSSKIHDEMKRVGEVPENSNLTVLNHGDVWQCNMLFKYARFSRKPIDMRFIDFQLSHYNTAGWDLIYFMHGGMDPEVRRKHLDLLLQVYVHEVKKTVTFYGLHEGDVASIEELKADMTRILPFRLISSFFFRPLFVSKYPFDLEAVMTNSEMSEAIGMDVRSISDPNFREKSELDLKELADEMNEIAWLKPGN
uniref:CHK kinase-like domain-containing protein n=2 Tax=Lygus hesperus TaxID=30085 RepID=A0A0A9YPQ1_LYGHE